jgi:hypothetical protein
MSAASPNPRPADDDSPIQGRSKVGACLELLIASLTPSCTRVVRLLSDSLERPLGLRSLARLQFHYLVCCYCRRYGRQLHAMRRLTIGLSAHMDESMTDKLDDESKERLKHCLRDAL